MTQIYCNFAFGMASGKIPQLQSLRGLASTAIFIHHGGLLTWWMEAFGVFSVMLFFSLSGYLMASHYSDRVTSPDFSYRRFLTGKVLKLYPLNLLCALVCLPLIAGAALYPFAANVTMTQGWLLNPESAMSCNGPSWTLGVTLLFYIIFPPLMIFALAARKRFLAMFAALMCVYFIYVSFLPAENSQSLIYLFPPVRVVDFILGMAVWVAIPLGFSVASRHRATLIELALVALIIVWFILYRTIPDTMREVSWWWLPAVGILTVFASGNASGLISRVLTFKPLVRLGGLSFSIYLIHYPVQRWLSLGLDALGIELPLAVYLILAFALTVTLCSVLNPLFISHLPRAVGSRLWPAKIS